MALRIITTIGDVKTVGARVYIDTEWSEYRVKYYKNGKTRVAADSFTDDKNDAISTAEHEVARVLKLYKKPVAKKSKTPQSAVAILKELEAKKHKTNPVKKKKTVKKTVKQTNDVYIYGVRIVGKKTFFAKCSHLDDAKETAQMYADKFKKQCEVVSLI